MGGVWVGMALLALLAAAATGRWAETGAAVLAGADAAVKLGLTLAGPIAFWSALLALAGRCGVTDRLSRAMEPVLVRLFPSAREDAALREALCCNLSADLLGLGNAATPAGIRAARRLAEHCPDGAASDELCRLVVLNTASVQLLPSTMAALRSSLGCAAPLDVLPAVWLASVLSVGAGLLAERLGRCHG